MVGRQRIDRVRRQYNQWVANQTLEDYALRFTAKSARKPLIIQQLLDTMKALLKLEWTYQSDQPSESAAPAVLTERPSSDHIQDLLRLGQIGYVRGIQAKLVEIERESENHEAFVAEMREIIGRFDLKKYIAVLEALQADDAR